MLKDRKTSNDVESLQKADGVVVGSSHLEGTDGENAIGLQDAILGGHNKKFGVRIEAVADGCSKCQQSKLGAYLLVRLAIAGVLEALDQGVNNPTTLGQHVQNYILDKLRKHAELFGLDCNDAKGRQHIEDLFFATLLLGVVTPTWTAVYAAGDGYIVLNGKLLELKPLTGNYPGYLAYRLTAPSIPELKKSELRLIETIQTATLNSLVLASDGAEPLTRANAPCQLVDLHQDDSLFVPESDELGRFLRKLNKRLRFDPTGASSFQVVEDGGTFSDDAAIVVLRRDPATFSQVKAEKLPLPPVPQAALPSHDAVGVSEQTSAPGAQATTQGALTANRKRPPWLAWLAKLWRKGVR